MAFNQIHSNIFADYENNLPINPLSAVKMFSGGGVTPHTHPYSDGPAPCSFLLTTETKYRKGLKLSFLFYNHSLLSRSECWFERQNIRFIRARWVWKDWSNKWIVIRGKCQDWLQNMAENFTLMIKVIHSGKRYSTGCPKKTGHCLISCNVKAINDIAIEINIIAFRKD
jgi:hypothetical protein